MVRLELIGNRAVEDDLYDLFRKQELNPFYTKLAEVQGFGDAGTRRGDHIFPEENFLLIFYCEEAVADAITEVVRELKRIFPGEGIVLYKSQAERLC